MTRTQLISGNVWEQALHRHLVSHVDDERELLQAYQEAAVQSESSAFRYLVSTILEDEERHHKVFADMASTLETEVDCLPEAFAVPRLGHWGFERARILELTEAFLVQERKDALLLQDLEVELDPVKDTTMWPLLVRLMQADTSKHIAILEFVKDQVTRKWDSSQAEWSGIENVDNVGVSAH
jgi:hypothetical protein